MIRIYSLWSPNTTTQKKPLQSLIGYYISTNVCVLLGFLPIEYWHPSGPPLITAKSQSPQRLAWFYTFLASFNDRVYFEKLSKPPSLIYIWTPALPAWAAHGATYYMPSPSTLSLPSLATVQLSIRNPWYRIFFAVV